MLCRLILLAVPTLFGVLPYTICRLLATDQDDISMQAGIWLQMVAVGVPCAMLGIYMSSYYDKAVEKVEEYFQINEFD